MPHIAHPKKPSDITAKWIKHVFSEAGLCSIEDISDINVQPLGPHVKGLLSSICRVNINYKFPALNIPSSVVIKFPPEREETVNFGNKMRVFEREQRFYKELANRCPIRIPKCYFSIMNEEKNEYILLLEDERDWTPGDQVKGLTVNQTKSAVLAIAKFHSRWWESEELQDLTWMPDENRDCLHAYKENWDEFKDEHKDILNARDIYIGDLIARNGQRVKDLTLLGPQTIIHYDFRADNMMFNEKDEILVLDWQTALRSFGAFDVVRAVCGSHHGALQKNQHVEFLKLWYQELLDSGVNGYTFDEAWRDYRTGIIMSSYVPVAAHHFLSHEGSHGQAVLKAMIKRIFFAMNECSVAALLE